MTTWRCVWLTLILSANVCVGFAQNVSIGDFARQERARRKAADDAALARSVVNETVLQQALRLSGAKRQLEQAAEAAQQLPHADESFSRIMSEAFDTNRLMAVLESSTAGKMNDAVLKDVLAWYRTPAGARIAAAEIRASLPESRSKVEEFARTLQANPPSTARMNLVRDLLQESHAVEFTVELTLNAIKAMRDGAVAAGADIAAPTPEDEDAFRLKTTPALSEGMRVGSLFTYQSLSDADLAQYLVYVKSRSAAAFHDALRAGFSAAFADAGRHLGKQFGELKSAER